MPSLLRQLPAFVLASLLTSWAAPATAGAGRANPFFAFDNGVGRGDGWSPEKQAVTLARLGYAGIGYTGLDDLATRQAAFQAASLRIFSVYVAAAVTKTPAFDPRLPESFPQLAATGTDVWLTCPASRPTTSAPSPSSANSPRPPRATACASSCIHTKDSSLPRRRTPSASSAR
jgi:hypothetical protein